jgi:hypothetical protein
MPHLCDTCIKATIKKREEPKCKDEGLEIVWSDPHLEVRYGKQVNVNGGVKECSGYMK